MLSTKKLESENRKGLHEIMAEIAEQEGNFLEAARHYLQAAKFQANAGLDACGVELLQRNHSRCAEIAFYEALED